MTPTFSFARIAAAVSLLLISTLVWAQQREAFPKGIFHPPVPIPLYLAGNFGELRSNHFHTGIDIKTQGVEGIDVLAAEAGYVSRIRISPAGYGNALYIVHPNGYTTVYAHLQRFEGPIAAYAREQQYAQQAFQVDIEVPADVLPVKRGQRIGLSGNTGSSGGPHLHFEIRETATEEALNPLLFGFEIKDNIPPQLRGLRLYPLDENSYVDGRPEAKSWPLNGTNGKYIIKDNPRITAWGNIGMALHAVDLLNEFPNKCGIYELSLHRNEEPVFGFAIDRINFDQNRYINTHKDYSLFHVKGFHYHRSFLAPNNPMPMYTHGPERGAMLFNDGQAHAMRYEVKDAYGNTSGLSFSVQALAAAPAVAPKTLPGTWLAWDEDQIFRAGGLRMMIPNGALYQSIRFQFDSLPACKGCLTPVYRLGDSMEPLQKEMTLRLRVDSIPAGLRPEQLVAVRINEQGRVSSAGGSYADGFLQLKTRSFGKYAVMADTFPPLLQPLQTTINRRGMVRFKVGDDLSGIASYNAWINDRWELLEYDTKSSRMWIDLSKITLESSNALRVELVDNCGNRAAYEVGF